MKWQHMEFHVLSIIALILAIQPRTILCAPGARLTRALGARLQREVASYEMSGIVNSSRRLGSTREPARAWRAPDEVRAGRAPVMAA